MQVALGQHYKASSFSVDISETGQVVALKDNTTDYAAASEPGYLLQAVVKGVTLSPTKAIFEKDNIVLYYAGQLTARIKVQARPSYLVFTVVDVSKNMDAIIWGPFNTVLADTIGNTVGVVRTAAYAIGLQCLHKSTSGGVLENEEGAVFDRGTTATARPFGASLQAFAINRSVDRKIKVWNRWPNVPVKAIPDGALQGSSIALFGCAPGHVLPVIKTITLTEQLPYARWKGDWIKTSPESGRPYMITTFSEQNIDTFLTYAKKMGMAGVYHEDPFDTWGHFVLKPSLFPHGRQGFKSCVDKAHAMGLRLGFHTLTNFITTNDSFVSPRPDHRLAQAGAATLVASITPDVTTITVDADTYFRMRSDLNSVLIGDEIVSYTDVTAQAPYQLTGCLRGAFGTAKAAHKANAPVARLIDHPYKVFFPDWALQREIADNIARFINETGADQMDFDGHEGTYASGMGDLSFNSFAEEVFRKVDHPVVFGSSRDNHYFWHLNNYLNWGEPWYGGFRESQSDVRMANQPFYENNYLPNMLGWFLITAQTNPDDIDWMLARAAGFNAGYALVLRKEALNNPQMEEIIHRINTWTAAQRSHLFTNAQQQWLRNPENDARLITSDSAVRLQEFSKFVFEYEARVLQPGQPTLQSWDFQNIRSQQTPQVLVHALGEEGHIVHPVVGIDNTLSIHLPITLEAGQTLVINNTLNAGIYDRKGRLLREVPIHNALPALSAGRHQLSFDGTTDANSPVKLKIEIKLLNNETLLHS
ncbi:hypothetical protein DCM91_13350 [Chitinophaga costaii]|nr:hypothetical protein DCM91_13350 [Chitinophaga costaii]